MDQSISRRRILQAGSAGLAAAISAPFTTAQTPIKLKCANNAPANVPVNQRLAEAFEQVRADTGGRLDIQLYPANQLGSDNDLFAQIRSGAIDFYSNAGSLMSGAVPEAAASAVAFAFKSYDDAWAAVDGELGAHIRDRLASLGVLVFDKAIDIGFHQLTSGTRPIRTAADMTGFKLRVPNSPLYVSLFRALGAAPTPISFGETYQSLQTRLIDGQTAALGTIQATRFYEVQKYCSITNHMWECQWFMANGRSWDKLAQELKEVVTKRVGAAILVQRVDMAKLNVSAEAELKSKGLVFNTADADSFRKVLAASGYYAEARRRLGERAWALLQKQVGTLG